MRYAISFFILIVLVAGCEKKETPAAPTKQAFVAVAKDIKAGEVISSSRMIVKREGVDGEYQTEKKIPWNQREWVLHHKKSVNRDIRKGHFLLFSDIAPGKPHLSDNIAEGMVLRTFQVETGNDHDMHVVLAPGDWVNLIGLFPETDGKYKAYRIFTKGARLFKFGERDLAESGDKKEYVRTVTLEVSLDTSRKLKNLLTYLSGELSMELHRRPRDRKRTDSDISPQLAPLTLRAKEPTGMKEEPKPSEPSR